MYYSTKTGSLTAEDTSSPFLGTGALEPLLRSYARAFPVSVSVYDLDGGLVAEAGDDGDRNGRPSVTAEIEVAGERVGSVSVTLLDPAREDGDRIAALFAEQIADRAARQAELDAMAGELLDKYEEVTLLYELSSALGSVFDIPGLCEIALDKAIHAVSAGSAYVALEDGGEVTIVATRGLAWLVGVSEPRGEGLSGHVVRTGKQVLLHEGEEFADADRVTEATLSVPLVYTEGGETHVLGALTLSGKPSGRRFTAGDSKVATAIAGQLAVAVHGSRLVDSLREAERVQQEIEIAAEIQHSLLPESAPDVPGLEVAGLYIPAARVGGDYYDLIADREGRLSVVIADVAGHSIGSALMMAMARSVIRREIAEGKGPAGVLEATNAMLFEDLCRAELFITVACARYEPATRLLSLANGAHNPPLLRRAADGAVVELDADGMAAGMVAAPDYEETTVELEAGDTVLLYTDGVTEARSPAGEQLGEARLKEMVASAGSVPPGELVGLVHTAVREHTEGAQPQDDVTLVALRAAAE